MSPRPLYSADNLRPPAYQLRYVWTGWPSEPPLADRPDVEPLERFASRLEADGIRLLESRWTDQKIQLTLSTEPSVAPAEVAARTKGRLQYEMRSSGVELDFSRKFGVRSVGDVRRETIEKYVGEQVSREGFADGEYASLVDEHTRVDDSVQLDTPSRSRHGRYWYNLHLVLVAHGRYRTRRPRAFRRKFDWCRRVAASKGHGLSALSVMPDHVHLGLRAHYEESPEAVALAYMNNLAYAFDQRAIWEDSYYVGTFGEYDMDAVRESWTRE